MKLLKLFTLLGLSAGASAAEFMKYDIKLDTAEDIKYGDTGMEVFWKLLYTKDNYDLI